MMKRLAWLLLFSSPVFARSPYGSIRSQAQFFDAQGEISDYQIGPEWGKTPVTQAYYNDATPVVQRALKATARVSLGFSGSGTAFVLGEKNGQMIFGTNHHVIEDAGACRTARISFPLLNISNLSCDKVLGSWSAVDFTVFTVKGLSAEQKQSLLKVARGFVRDGHIAKGQELVTVGFGIAGNPGQRSMMAELDEDCKVYSQDDDLRFIADPDELNPSGYKTWAFAMGCDVSHGDSGSAMVDRETGDVVGILFTGRIPKNAIVRDRKWLDGIYDTNDAAVWKELSFAVPASKIIEVAGSLLN